MTTALAAGLGLAIAGAFIALLVVAREVRGPRHTRTTEYAGFHDGPPLDATATTS